MSSLIYIYLYAHSPLCCGYKQLKKKLSRMQKIELQGWKGVGRVKVGAVQRRDSQIGQLLHYQLAVQLKRIQLHLTPGVTPGDYGPPSPLLGVFIEQGKVCDCS